MASQNAASRTVKPGLIVSGFIAVGKTWLTNQNNSAVSGYEILDLDSSGFSKDAHGNRRDDFKDAYLNAMRDSWDPDKIILVSTHREIRDALVENKRDFVLVYPPKDAKDEWIARLKSRGSADTLVKFIEDKWETLVEDCENQTNCRKAVLKKGQYLSDIMEDLAEQMSKPPSRKP